jgi:predicted O-methyltransferase YrrM
MGRARVVVLALSAVALAGTSFLLGRWLERSTDEACQPTPMLSPAQSALLAADPRDSLAIAPYIPLLNESPEGRDAARLLLRYLDSGDSASLQKAQQLYEAFESAGDYHDEYPALRWFCAWSLADEQHRDAMLEDPEGRRFVEFFSSRDWSRLRSYLLGKYGLTPEPPEDLRWLDELVRFNSPGRAARERTDRVMSLLALEPGMTVADIGAGLGFFTYRLAHAVGPEGRVLAVEMTPFHLDYLLQVTAAEALDNVEVIPTDGAFPDVAPASLDRVLLSSSYQGLYLYTPSEEREAWFAALREALAPEGLVVVSENEPIVPPGSPTCRGTAVSRPLVEAQILSHGFELLAAENNVPQRYVLVLRKAATSR